MLLRRAARANEHSESTGMHNAAKPAGLRYFVHSMQTHNKPNDKDPPRAPAQARAFGRVQHVDAAALGEGSHNPSTYPQLLEGHGRARRCCNRRSDGIRLMD